MNPRHPMVTLTNDEVEKLRAFVRGRGAPSAAKAIGINPATLRKAGMEEPIARLTAQAIRGSLDRL
jgi:hypothetical protein